MNRACAALALLLLTAAPACAAEETPETVLPVLRQKISFHLPAGWVGAFEDKNDQRYLQEFIPKGEDINAWSNLLAVQGFKGMGGKVTGKDFLDRVAAGHQHICPDTVVNIPLEATSVDGHPAAAAIIGCGAAPEDKPGEGKKSEIAYFLAINGDEDLYLFNKSVRGPVFAPSSPAITAENAGAYFGEVLPVHLCKAGGAEGECLK
jgi:hypothetical protein